MVAKFFKNIRNRKSGITNKLVASLMSIAAILVLSSVISVIEYRRMSDYISDLIASNINSINESQRLVSNCDEYNTRILELIGSADAEKFLMLDQKGYIDRCDSISRPLSSMNLPMADSVIYSYTAYMLTSLELRNVLVSDFINSREWYFERLQPSYQVFKDYIGKLNHVIYSDLKENSQTFQQGYYRSIIPGVVTVGAGLALLLLLMFYLLVYYVKPLKKMLFKLGEYRQYGRKYSYEFDGDDEFIALNGELSELVEENIELRKRLKERRNFMNTSNKVD